MKHLEFNYFHTINFSWFCDSVLNNSLLINIWSLFIKLAYDNMANCFLPLMHFHPRIIKWKHSWQNLWCSVWGHSKHKVIGGSLKKKTKQNSLSMLVGQHTVYCPINFVKCQWLDQPHWQLNISVTLPAVTIGCTILSQIRHCYLETN